MTSGSPATNDPAAPGTTCGATIAPHSAIGSGWLNELGHVATDAPCHRCGYNLRTIAVESVCPECGLATAESAPLAAREPRRLIGARNACLLLVAAMALAALLQHGPTWVYQYLFPNDLTNYMSALEAHPGQSTMVDPGQPWKDLGIQSLYLLGIVLFASAYRRFVDRVGDVLPWHLHRRNWRWIRTAVILATTSWIACNWIWTLGGGGAFCWMAQFTWSLLAPLFLVASVVVIRRCTRLVTNTARRLTAISVRVVATAAFLVAAVVMAHDAVMTAWHCWIPPAPRPGFIDMTRWSESPKFAFREFNGYLVVTASAPSEWIQGEMVRSARIEESMRSSLFMWVFRLSDWISRLRYGIAGVTGLLLLTAAAICHRAARQAGLARMKPAVISGGREA